MSQDWLEQGEAASDVLAAYVATVPRNLRGDAWARWRAKNPPPYLQPGARRGGRCTICGGELGAVLNFCHACGRREFELLRQLPPAPKEPPRRISSVRHLREEWREYPRRGEFRPARRLYWYVAEDEHGGEVTRSLDPDVAEMFL